MYLDTYALYMCMCIKTLTHYDDSSGHRTAEPVCSVKHGEGLIIITGLDTGAAPELSLARPFSGDTHTGL